jgi:hypothetical protein
MSKDIWVYRGSSEESWLTVYEDGRIQLHSENDGVSVLRHGVQARDEWITLAGVTALERRHGKQLVEQVRTALAELTHAKANHYRSIEGTTDL